MPGMSGPGAQINSLIDMMPQQQPQQPQAPRQYGTWDPDMAYYMQPQPPLYSGGGGAGMTAGGGGAGSVFSPPADLRQYFNPDGTYKLDDPRQVAAEGGISLGDLANSFLPRYGKGAGETAGQVGYGYPSDRGGFFSIENLYDLTRQPTTAAGMGGSGLGLRTSNVPSIATYGQQLPSTNNWRLLGRGPGYIMRNGFIIDARDPGERGLPKGMSSSSADAEQGMGGMMHVALGTGGNLPMLFAPGYAPATAYWPGSITGGVPLGQRGADF